MRGILIDSNERSFTVIETSAGLEELYAQIGCGMVEVVGMPDGEHDLWVDEEGLLKLNGATMFFEMVGLHQPIAGKGLILKYDGKGGSTDATLDIEELENTVSFKTMIEIQEQYGNA